MTLARVAWVMKILPLKPVFSVKYGTPAAWSMWKWDTSNRSTVDRSTTVEERQRVQAASTGMDAAI